MTVDFSLPASKIIYATDAMGAGEDDEDDMGGFGIVGLELTETEVLDCWRSSFQPGYSIARLDGSISSKLSAKEFLAATVPFTRLPKSIFARDWTILAAGRWRYADHITAGEGRAHFKLIQAIAANNRLHDQRYVVLQDNFPVASAMSKGRAASPMLNFYCRRRAASALAGNIISVLPWVQSKLMPADYASRLSTHNGGALADESSRTGSSHTTENRGAAAAPVQSCAQKMFGVGRQKQL